MRIVVTGGAGFIGANLCRELDQRGHAVVALDDLSTGFESNLDGVGAELVKGSILDRDVLQRGMEGADGVVHLAARPSVPRSIADPGLSNEINVTGTVNVLEAARDAGNAHVVVASSSSVYGANPQLPKVETMTPRPLSPYAVSKLAAESYALAFQACYGMPALALRFFNVYGPLQAAGHAYAAVLPAFVDAALRGVPVPVHGDGLQTRDFTFVGSVVALIADALERRVAHETPVNLAFGSRTSLVDLLALVEDVVGRPLAREHLPPRAGDVRDSQADQTLLRSLFPGATPVPLRDGVAATVRWFESLDR